MIYRFADFNFSFSGKTGGIDGLCRNFAVSDDCVPDARFEITENDISYERERCEFEAGNSGLEFSAAHRKIAEWLPLHNSFVLHSAVIDCDGSGIAFSAKSGTGKTTHMLLWKKAYGERVKIINGDKPIIRFFDDDLPYAYGTAWCGKEGMTSRSKTQLTDICFIERNSKNSVIRIDKAKAAMMLLKQIYMPKNPLALSKTLLLADRLVKSCDFHKINCNMDISAAQVAYSEIIGRKEKV